MKYVYTFLSLALLSLTTTQINTSAPQQAVVCASATPAQTKQKTVPHVWGHLYVVGFLKYLGEGRMDVKLKNIEIEDRSENPYAKKTTRPIELKPCDVTVDIWASSDGESKNWADHCDHPVLGNTFPSRLPLKMLEDKKEGDPLIFTLRNQETRHTAQVLLLCHGRDGQKLEDKLAACKKFFAKAPDFFGIETKTLIAQDIVQRNPHYYEFSLLRRQLEALESDLSPTLLNGELCRINPKKLEAGKRARANFLDAMQEERDKWVNLGHDLIHGEIPEYIHGRNGFKLTPSSPAPAVSASASAGAAAPTSLGEHEIPVKID